MQCLKFLVKITNKIDQITKRFLWGNHTGQPKLHMIKLSTIIKPKKLGGSSN